MKLRLALTLLAAIAATMPAAAASSAAGGRALELVTPGYPAGGIFRGSFGLSPDGARFAYSTLGPMPGAPAGDLAAANLAHRGAGGWDSEPLGFSYSIVGEAGLFPVASVAFSEDLSASIWLAEVPLTVGAPPEGDLAFYRREESGSFSLLWSLGRISSPNLIRASADASRVVFTSNDDLLPAAAGRSGDTIYELVDGALRMADGDGAGGVLSPCGVRLLRTTGVSRSARRIYFTGRPADCAVQRVFLGEDGAAVEVSTSRCTRPDCNPPQPVFFTGATPSGSRAYMVTAQQLTNADVDELADLYAYDAGNGELTRLTPRSEGGDGSVVQEQIVASADGSEQYLFASGRLIPGQGSADGTNLYLADGDGLHFLASLPITSIHTAPGSALLATPAALDEADTDERTDVYRYDAALGRFSLLSKGPTGGNGPFDALLDAPVEESVEGFRVLGVYAPHPFSDAGDRAFFTTAEPLAPEDDDESADLYEWAGGTVGLLSPGTAGAVEFIGANPDGTTALFKTSATLLPADRDGGEYDVYAARIGGGFAESTVPIGAECAGAECHGPAGSPHARPSPASIADPVARKRRALRIRHVRSRPGAGATALVFAPAPGVVRVRGRAELGGDEITVARGRAAAVRPGLLRVPLRLTASLRRRLSGGRTVPVRLVVLQHRSRAVEVTRLTWSGER
jgi:hypothetical protein